MEKISVKFDIDFICRQIMTDLLNGHDLDYHFSKEGEVVFDEPLSEEIFAKLKASFNENGITVSRNKEIELVDRIREAITSIIEGEEFKKYKLSTVLSDRLNYSYAHLSNVFSNSAYTSIESYFILNKIEKVKSFLLNEGLSLTEISHRLGYSSVAHLSSQFKKHTGLTPSIFQKLVKKRELKSQLY